MGVGGRQKFGGSDVGGRTRGCLQAGAQSTESDGGGAARGRTSGDAGTCMARLGHVHELNEHPTSLLCTRRGTSLCAEFSPSAALPIRVSPLPTALHPPPRSNDPPTTVDISLAPALRSSRYLALVQRPTTTHQVRISSGYPLPGEQSAMSVLTRGNIQDDATLQSDAPLRPW